MGLCRERLDPPRPPIVHLHEFIQITVMICILLMGISLKQGLPRLQLHYMSLLIRLAA